MAEYKRYGIRGFQFEYVYPRKFILYATEQGNIPTIITGSSVHRPSKSGSFPGCFLVRGCNLVVCGIVRTDNER